MTDNALEQRLTAAWKRDLADVREVVAQLDRDIFGAVDRPGDLGTFGELRNDIAELRQWVKWLVQGLFGSFVLLVLGAAVTVVVHNYLGH